MQVFPCPADPTATPPRLCAEEVQRGSCPGVDRVQQSGVGELFRFGVGTGVERRNRGPPERFRRTSRVTGIRPVPCHLGVVGAPIRQRTGQRRVQPAALGRVEAVDDDGRHHVVRGCPALLAEPGEAAGAQPGQRSAHCAFVDAGRRRHRFRGNLPAGQCQQVQASAA